MWKVCLEKVWSRSIRTYGLLLSWPAVLLFAEYTAHTTADSGHRLTAFGCPHRLIAAQSGSFICLVQVWPSLQARLSLKTARRRLQTSRLIGAPISTKTSL